MVTLEMPTTTELTSSSNCAAPLSAWDRNTWPEYPPSRVWQDLAYKPSKRPFYPFVGSSFRTGPPLRQSGLRIRQQGPCSERERLWRETQAHWWNRAFDGSKGDEAEETETTGLFAFIMMILDTVRAGVGYLASLMTAAGQAIPGRTITTEGVLDTVLGVLGLIVLLGFYATIIVFVSGVLFVLADGLVFQHYVNFERMPRPPPIWYENVPCFRSWNVAPQR
ncbi:hypothetical protein SUNI508_03545 [Seiridium unicorne]|uniref:Uncharacterized protein n=1 Tax=Seiridium unicorne TaxID=138068 RepID=A0ABR2VCM1_9PEZI